MHQQYRIYRNTNPNSQQHIPYLLNVQADLLASLKTVTVLPVYRADQLQGALIKRLMIAISIEQIDCVIVTPEIAAIPCKLLGECVGDLSSVRSDIVAALDLLLTGV
jgi:toxin CcdB